MQLSVTERANNIEYLIARTDYSKDYIKSLRDDKLFAMVKRIKATVAKDTEYIRRYFIAHPGNNGEFTAVMLAQLTYNDLRVLARSVKHFIDQDIPFTLTVQTRPIYDKVAPKIEKTTAYVDDSFEEDDDYEMEFYSEEELQMMYGEDAAVMSMGQLRKANIKVDQVDHVTNNGGMFEEVMEQMIKYMLELKLCDQSNMPYNREKLKALGYQRLRDLYEKLTETNRKLPDFYEVQLQVKKSLDN